MLSFRSWLSFGEVIRETKESILRETAATRSAALFLELVARSLNGRLIRESRAAHDEVIDDVPEEAGDDEVEKEVSTLVGDGSWTIEKAKHMQDLARKVRWSAMLDRKEAVEQVRKILADEWEPFMKDRRDEVVRQYEALKATGIYGSDDDIKRAVANKTGLSTWDVGQIMNGPHNEWAVLGENENESEEDDDEWDMPGLDDDESKESSEEGQGEREDGSQQSMGSSLSGIVDSVEPILIKLGYLADGQLEFGEEKEKIKALDFAIRNAAREVGNEPPEPENETIRLLASNKGDRAKAERDFMEFMAKEYKKIANSTWMRISQYMGRPDKDDFEDDIKTGGRRGSIHVTDWPDVLNTGIESVLDSLKTREPTKKGEAPPWKDINLLSKDTVGQIMGSIATRFRPQNITRKAARERRKAAGMSGSSTDAVQHLSGGAMQDDGSQASIDAADTRTRDSLSNAVNSSLTEEILDAFRKSMADVRQVDPLWAMLICARYELNCTGDGRMPDASANRLLSLLSGAGSMGMTQTPENFFKRLASVGMPSQNAEEQLLAQKALTFWDALKDMKRQSKSAQRGGARRNAPVFQSPTKKPTTKEEMDDWKKFVHTVRDACGEGEKILWSRMSELLSDSGHRTPGQVSHKDWDILKFLKLNFRGARIESSSPAPGEQNVKISFPASAGNSAKTYDILVTNNKDISVVQDGFDDMEEFEIPDPVTCPKCKGMSPNCTECEGDGMVLNTKSISELEWKLRQWLSRGHRNAKKKS